MFVSGLAMLVWVCRFGDDHMAMPEQNPERVMSYFQDRRVRYAA